MPDPGEYHYLIDYLHEVGPAQAIGGTIHPVTWQEIAAWTEATGVRLDREEMSLLRECSCAYASMAVKARKPDCPSPWVGQVDRAAVSKKIGDMLHRISKTRKNHGGLRKTHSIG